MTEEFLKWQSPGSKQKYLSLFPSFLTLIPSNLYSLQDIEVFVLLYGLKLATETPLSVYFTACSSIGFPDIYLHGDLSLLWNHPPLILAMPPYSSYATLTFYWFFFNNIWLHSNFFRVRDTKLFQVFFSFNLREH